MDPAANANPHPGGDGNDIPDDVDSKLAECQTITPEVCRSSSGDGHGEEVRLPLQHSRIDASPD
ncbi:hypothetical protein RW1_028_01210 [Rhodococcus wratislaviensis NBRC 100605]|uniref:Uncharacterized protein n=1 Tax=Rhodococcus wratislaviensis NBRC 100605 TaxID=1219028 RepID=X0Q4J4_RHOWR|nr:hypothetical protein RW1_028_01210 [Rhodococcus wratislaviensis NBRC 100605]